MRVRWLGVGVVALLVVCTLLLKSRTRHNAVPPALNSPPTVILVADLREANDPNDLCATIIRTVREASRRGVPVVELSPDSKSEVLRRYRVLTVPTVLFLDKSGNEIGRFEGEDASTVSAIQTRLSALARSEP